MTYYLEDSRLCIYAVIVILTNTITLAYLDLTNTSPALARLPFASFLLSLGQAVTVVLLVFGTVSTKEIGQTKRGSTSKKRKLYRLINFTLCLAYLTIGIYVVALLLGAPVLTNGQETFLLSYATALWIMCPLLIFDAQAGSYLGTGMLKTPLGCIQHLYGSKIASKAESSLVTKYLILNLYSVCFGVWFGAFPLKLDWMSPWKTYPVTSVVGGMLGSIAAQCFVLAKPVANYVQNRFTKSKLKAN